MNEARVAECMRFYLTATKLKELIRSGWDENHWNISGRLESVAEHVYGTMILAISIYSNSKIDIDLDKVLKMLCMHEIGDITPFENISIEEKNKREHEGVKEVLGDLYTKDEYYNLLIEFDEHITKESKFAYMCDKMDACIKAKLYQDQGRSRDLNDKELKMQESSRFIKAKEEGCKTMIDVWLRHDQNKFEGDEIFKSLIEYLKNNNLNI